MNRLVVNPSKPDAWEIQLRDGVNQFGRGDASDFQIADSSVSGSHCRIVVNDGTVSIQDLGSTNGTFINGAKVQEQAIQDGQTIRLGNVEMLFYADAPKPAAAPAGAPRLRVTLTSHAPEPAVPSAPVLPPPLAPVLDTHAASSACRFHPKSVARWFCHKCTRSFCDLCVNSRTHGKTVAKTCRSCGVECTPLEVQITAPTESGFLASLPGAFVYPFRGTGVLIMIFSTLLFAALGARMSGIFSILIKFGAIGYLFSYMQNIIHATANEEKEMPELPGMDDLFGGFVRLAGTVVMSFGLALGLMVATLSGWEIPVSAIIIAMILGCLYFPMAFLAVAMKDNVLACNPLVIVPSILRVPGQYAVAVVIFISIFGIKEIGDLISASFGSVTFTTTDMSVLLMSFGVRIIWSFISIYLLVVNIRIMGLLYLTQMEKLGWY